MPSPDSSTEGSSAPGPNTDKLPSGRYRFGSYEVDFHSGELRKSGLRIRIQEQPLQVLSILLSRPGEVVTREEFRALLWPADTFVDFDHGLNSAIRRLRHVFEDDPDKPRLIETLPRHGYRFIGTGVVFMSATFPGPGEVVEDTRLSAGGPAGEWPGSPERRHNSSSSGYLGRRRFGRRAWFAVIAAGLLLWTAGFVAGIYRHQRSIQPPLLQHKAMLAVLPFNDLSDGLPHELLADGMTEELITRLGQTEPQQFGVIAHTSVEQYKRTRKPVSAIGKELGVFYVLEGSTRVEGTRVRIAVQLIEVRNQTHLWAEEYDGSLDNALSLQAEVADGVTRAVRKKLSP
jgi:TolB-like protein/DNA-binding winged helix-turn-helix (wHTH) protein